MVATLAWFDHDRLVAAFDGLIDAVLPDDGAALKAEERSTRLGELDAEIEALGRSEESLIEAAFARGVDVLRTPTPIRPACWASGRASR